jgi:hypothetical protein
MPLRFEIIHEDILLQDGPFAYPHICSYWFLSKRYDTALHSDQILEGAFSHRTYKLLICI